MERRIGWRDEPPARGRADSPCRFFFATPSQSAQNKNAEQARVASASLYPEQEGVADSNGVMLYYLSATNRSYSRVVGGGTSYDYPLPRLLALACRHRVISIDEPCSLAAGELAMPPDNDGKYGGEC